MTWLTSTAQACAQTATITITGTNDAPTVGAAISASANENDAGFTVDMLSGASDIDTSDVLSVANVTGLMAGVTVTGTSLNVDPSDAAFQSLALGAALTIVVSYDVIDGNGGSAAQTATITITGTNDAPVVNAVTGSASEDGPAITLTADFSDVDAGDSHTFSVDATGTTGLVTDNGDGTFSYDPNGAFESLAVGETATDTFTYTVTDNNGASTTNTVTITIIGTNDAPIAGPAIVTSASEDVAIITVALLANSSDIDNGAILSVTNLTGLGMGITFNGIQTLLIDPTAAGYQSLAMGETEVLVVTYDVTDEHGATAPRTATITIIGTNDAPTVTTAITASANEDDAGFALDMLAGASDVDNGAVLSVANVTGLAAGVTFAGSTLTIDPSDAAFQSLAIGAVLNIVVSYDVVDEHNASIAQTATITITGTNDAPTVTAAVTASAFETDASFSVDLLAGASDIDVGDVLNVTSLTLVSGDDSGVTISGNSLTIDPSVYAALNAGDTEVITYSYDVIDGNGGTVTQTATITITGVGAGNGNPVVSGPVLSTVTEDDAAYTLDLLSGASDPDIGDVLNVANLALTGGDDSGVTINGNNLDIDPDVYTALAVGESETITYSYDIEDGNGGSVSQTATITITGENDAPSVAAALAASGVEDGPIFTLDLLSGASDVDNGAVLSIANISFLENGVTLSGSTLTVDPSHPDFQFLAPGNIRTLTITFDVVDEHGASVPQTAVITVTGTNDAPTVAAALTAAANEDDAGFTIDMLAGASDVDNSAVLSVANAAGLAAGITFAGSTLTVDPSDAAFQSLALGEVQNIVVSYDVVDGLGGSVPQTATITITGTNDAPTVAAALTAAANEDDASFTIDMLAGANDVDNGATLSVANVTGVGAGMTFIGTDLIVDPFDAVFQSLALGEALNIVVSYDVVDEHGASVPQTATVTITGTNDTPTVAGALSDAANEDDASFTIDMLAGASDVDNGAVLSVSGVSGLVPGVSFAGSTLTIDPSGAAFQSLAQGEIQTIIVGYTISDEHGASVPQIANITITGTNDAPTVAATLSASGTEDGTIFTADLLAGASDVDNGAVLSIANVSALPGGVTFDGLNTITVDPSDASLQFLPAGFSTDFTVTFDVVDEHGASVAQSLTITITGTNDVPTISGALTAAANEDDAAIIIDMLSGAADIDIFTILAVTNITGLTAGLLVTGTTLAIDPAHAAFQSLAQGETLDIIVGYDIIDGDGGVVAQTVTITLTGVNDAPIAVDFIVYGIEGDGIVGTTPMNGNLFVMTTDIDNGAVLTIVDIDGVTDGAAGIVASYGTLTWDVNAGTFVYEIDDTNPAVHDLLTGEDLLETFSYTITDEHGATTTAVLTISIDGLTDGVFTAQADVHDLRAVVTTYGATAFNNNFLDALDGDDDITLLDGTEAISYLAEFAGQTFTGGAGDDTIRIINDFMNADGGTGSDTIDFTLLTTQAGFFGGVSLDLSAGDVDLRQNGSIDLTATNFENIIGTSLGDQFTTSAAANHIDAGGGDDEIIVAAGTDTTLDTYIGGAGTFDILRNLTGSNLVFSVFDATDGTGTINGSGIEHLYLGGVSLLGTSGDDFFNLIGLTFREYSSAGDIILSTGDGNDTVMATGNLAVLSGVGVTSQLGYELGLGDDVFIGVSGTTGMNETVFGGSGNDTIDGGQSNDTLYGEDGDDTLLGGAGADILEGGAGADILDGGDSNDTLNIQAGDEELTDTFIGGAGTDTIFNLTGGDIAFNVFDATDVTGTVNGSGIEVIDMAGSVLLGTAGDDVFNFTGVRIQFMNDPLNGAAVSTGAGNDTVTGSNQIHSINVGSGTILITYDLGDGDDVFNGYVGVGNANVDMILGGAGDDIIFGGDQGDILEGGSGVDVLRGGDGNDRFIIRAGDSEQLDTFIGGLSAGHSDVIDNQTGGDFTFITFDATDLTETINGSGINQIDLNDATMNGTSADNLFNFTGMHFFNAGAVIDVSTDAGNDIVYGGTSSFMGYDLGAGDDIFIGGAAHDTIYGGSGSDNLNGGDGNDTFIIQAGDNGEGDTIIGGLGLDIIDNQSGGDFTFSVFDATDVTETVNGSGIERILLGGQTMLGTSGDNVFNFTGITFFNHDFGGAAIAISTGAGNDTIIASGEQSVFNGFSAMGYDLGDGDDIFVGGTSFLGSGGIRDTVFGGAGNDNITGGDGNDTLEGGAGADFLSGGSGNDTFNIRAGDNEELDTFIGGIGTLDTIFNLTGGDFTFSIFDATDATELVSGSGIERIDFASGTLFGTASANNFNFTGVSFRNIDAIGTTTVSTGAGDDIVVGTDQFGSFAAGGQAVDITYDLGDGDDTFTGTQLNETVIGGAGDDHISGGDFVDMLFGGDGDDIIFGDAGTDTLEGGAGVDFVHGGDGNDTIIIRAGDSEELDTFIGGLGITDVIDNQTGGDFTFTIFEAYDISETINGSGIERILFNSGSLLGTSGDNYFDFRDVQFRDLGIVGSLTVSTGAGNDTVFGTDESGTLAAGGGTSTFTYDLGAGDDSFTGSGNRIDIITGGTGDDILRGGDGSDQYEYNIGDGADVIDDNGIFDTDVLNISGYNFADATLSQIRDSADLLIDFGGGDSIIIRGALFGSANDQIEQITFADGTVLTPTDLRAMYVVEAGTVGDDLVTGSNNVDTLNGGAGDDILRGGDGSDTYTYAVGDGADIIEDNGVFDNDLLQITGYNIGDASFTRVPMTNDLLIDFGGGDSILLRNGMNNDSGDQIETVTFNGTSRTAAQIRQLVFDALATAGDDVILGTGASEILTGGAGDDILNGGDASDTYNYNVGDENDTIIEAGAFDTDVLNITGYASSAVTYRLSAAYPNDLVLDFGGGDTLTLVGFMGNGQGLESIVFTDGSFTRAQIRTEANTNGISETLIMGTGAAETITSTAADEVLIGDDGSDIYAYALGGGHDIIDDNGFFDTDVLEITGYNLADASFERVPGFDNDVRIVFSATDSIIIRNGLTNSNADNIESIVFLGLAETITLLTIRAAIIAQEQTTGDDIIVGFSSADIIDGGVGNDILRGGDDSDIYIFESGDGQDEIRDGGFFDTDVLSFTDYVQADATFSRGIDNNSDLIITFVGGDQVIVRNTLSGNNADQVEEIQFTDNTLNMDDVRTLLLAQQISTGDDDVFAFNTNETIEAGTGNDYIIGGDGHDIYVFNINDGQDIIDDQGFFDTDVASFVGRNFADASFSQGRENSNDLVITFGNGDSVTVLNGLSNSNANTIEQFMFDDMTKTVAEIKQKLLDDAVTAGDDRITGFSTNDAITGGAGNDFLIGGDGNDTFVFNANDGIDRIQDQGFFDTDVLDINGYDLADATFTRIVGTDHLLIEFLGSTDAVYIYNALGGSNSDQIEEFSFDDTLVNLTINDIIAMYGL